MHSQQSLVDQQVHPRGRRHGRADLCHAQRPGQHDLAASRKSQQADDNDGDRPVEMDAVDVLQRRGDEDQARLEEVAEDDPRAVARADDVAQLAGDVARQQETAQRHADVGRDEEVVSGFGKDDRHGQHDGVARLVGREAVVVRERGRILDARAKCQDEEFDLGEDVDSDRAGKVLSQSAKCRFRRWRLVARCRRGIGFGLRRAKGISSGFLGRRGGHGLVCSGHVGNVRCRHRSG